MMATTGTAAKITPRETRMPQLDTQLNVRSADFQANAQAMRTLVDDLKQQLARVASQPPS